MAGIETIVCRSARIGAAPSGKRQKVKVGKIDKIVMPDPEPESSESKSVGEANCQQKI